MIIHRDGMERLAGGDGVAKGESRRAVLGDDLGQHARVAHQALA